jgi:hypothetical protein
MMKTLLGWIAVIIIAGAIGAFLFYKIYLPKMLAEAIVKQEESVYIPKFVQARIRKYKAPVNEAAEDVIREIHKSDINVDQIIEAIDRTEEEQVYAMLDELTQANLVSTNQVFDICKKYFTVDFDIELLRKPFNENVDVATIKSALKNSDYREHQQAVDPQMAKAIIKQVLLQKEAEYRKRMFGE